MTAKTILSLVLSLCMWTISYQTVDLNLLQLQYVSDHLTVKDCRRLITALYSTKFQLSAKDRKPVRDNEPCLMHLVDWNKATGNEATVEDLSMRLVQIGKRQLASDVSQAVYHESSLRLHKFFLDNPFKETAEDAGDRMMVNDDDEEDKKKTKTAADKKRAGGKSDLLFRMSVVGLTIVAVIFVLLVLCLYCPAVFNAFCPRWCIDTYQSLAESAQETMTRLKTLTATEGFGMKKSQVRVPTKTDPNTQEERDRLIHSVMDI